MEYMLFCRFLLYYHNINNLYFNHSLFLDGTVTVWCKLVLYTLLPAPWGCLLTVSSISYIQCHQKEIKHRACWLWCEQIKPSHNLIVSKTLFRSIVFPLLRPSSICLPNCTMEDTSTHWHTRTGKGFRITILFFYYLSPNIKLWMWHIFNNRLLPEALLKWDKSYWRHVHNAKLFKLH